MPTLRMLAKSHVSETPDIKESLGVIRGGRVVLQQVLVGLHPLLHCFCVLWSVFLFLTVLAGGGDIIPWMWQDSFGVLLLI